MLLPYRAKNPPESFPFVTIGLIARALPHGEMAFQARQGLQRLGSNLTQAGSGYVA